MKVAFVGSEVYPFAKTGGLGDVLGSLPKAIHKLDNDVKVFMPKYACVDHDRYDLSYCWSIGEIPVRVYGKVHNINVYTTSLPNSTVDIYFIDYPPFFNRHLLYTNDGDEDERFILFQKAVIESMQRMKWIPDLIHCNDWQSALIPLYLKDNYSWDRMFDKTATLLTIHNIGYQGRFPKETMFKAEVRPQLFYENGPVEVWGSFCFLKTGIMYADTISTVSETYAKEVTTSEYGEGLEGVLRHRINDFYGILNGVDYTVWNPETDKHIPFHFSRKDLSGKLKNKEYLLKASHLPNKKNVPLIGIVSRLVAQKGFDIFQDAIGELMKRDAFWIILGSGEDRFENLLRSLSYAFPEKVYTYLGFNSELSHLIEAGSDMFLMPSRYEPCGLNQIYSLRYGTVPVVRKTGGLADTVLDWHEYLHRGFETGTGFSFNSASPQALISTVDRAIETYHNKEVWNKIIANGMTKEYSWEVSAEKYMEVYKKAIKNRKG